MKRNVSVPEALAAPARVKAFIDADPLLSGLAGCDFEQLTGWMETHLASPQDALPVVRRLVVVVWWLLLREREKGKGGRDEA